MARAVEPLVAADRVTVRYPDGTVGVREVDLAIGYHGFVCLQGPSGAGKSTILKLLAGEEIPSSGRLCLAGEDPGSWGWSQRLAWRRAVGYAGQDLALLEDRTALENVAYADQIRRGSDWSAAVAAAHLTLDRLALSAKAPGSARARPQRPCAAQPAHWGRRGAWSHRFEALEVACSH